MIVLVSEGYGRHRIDKNQPRVGLGEFSEDFLEEVTLELKLKV